jgi:hypothetical protein
MEDRRYDIVISIHILPYELEDYRRLIYRLNESTNHIDSHDVIIHSTLNLNDKLTEWSSSTIDQGETISLYNNINKLNVYSGSLHETSHTLLGVNDHRRLSIKRFKSQTKHMSYLDCDLYFNERHLGSLLNGLDSVSKLQRYYIVSPQVVKLWDNTWDCLVHTLYKHEPPTFHKTTDPRSVVNQEYGKQHIKPIQRYKWGGGWFNGFSMDLLSYVGIPTSFIGYGLDDTYTMECASLMEKYRYPVKQYILKNSVVMEDYININGGLKSHFTTNDVRDELLTHTRKQYKRECEIFLSKLKQTPYI